MPFLRSLVVAIASNSSGCSSPNEKGSADNSASDFEGRRQGMQGLAITIDTLPRDGHERAHLHLEQERPRRHHGRRKEQRKDESNRGRASNHP